MFDKYIIVTQGFRNTTTDGGTPDTVSGYELGIRLPYYRGLGLSMVESIDLIVDGTPVPAESLTLTVHGNSYAVTDLATVFDDRWEMGEIATLRVAQPGGLAPGCGFRTCRSPAAAGTRRLSNSPSCNKL